ncbi:hypothetical protein GCM10025857_12740 [Alicyclobacillus contaminans]|nr:hypothetical protein GCM10025857_12740 [Alicyclobacillus contaminans]
MTQKYDKEFKLHAVQLALESGKPASQVARELGISQKTLYGWVAKYKEDPSTPFVGSGNLKPEAKALRDLEREIRELREENAILKKLCASSQTTGNKVPIHPQTPLQIFG